MLRSSTLVRRARSLPRLAAVTAAAALLVGTVTGAPSSQAATAPSRPLGIDVSRWQSAGPDDTCAAPGIDWSRVSTTTRSFVFIRATRTKSGTTTADACFDRNWAGAEAKGVYRGAYHYAVPSAEPGSAARAARAFVAVTGRMQDAGDLPPVLDLETTGGLQPAQLVAWTSTWLTTVRALTGRQPMIYTYPSFWRSATGDSQAFHAYPLWIAHWTSTPSVPGGWPTYTVHQYSASGRVPGIGGDVDLDVFNGGAEALYAFAHPGTHPTAGTTGPVAYRGSPWRLSGHLRTDRGAAVPNATVRLYRKVGTGPWTAIATTRTSAGSAYYRFDVRPTSSASYKVRYSGGRDFAASWSGVRSHTIRDRAATVTTSATSATSVRKGAAVRLSGTLTRAVGGARLTGKRVTVYQRVGAGGWTVVRTLTTSATLARYTTTVRPARATSYKVVFAGSLANEPSTSPVRTVRTH